MNILFVSRLNDSQWLGPSQSVPAQIKAQSAIDNVLWFNINQYRLDKWLDPQYQFVNLQDNPSKELDKLPHPFDKPDIVVFEGCYEYPFDPLVKDIWKKRIPYVIVPRSQLTDGAQKAKHFKKIAGNILYFNRFIKKAEAIHYLTRKELEDSKRFKKQGYVIPNGVNFVPSTRPNNIETGIKGTYIGRIRLYQKGLDLLIDAVEKEKETVTNYNLTLDLYGPDLNGAVAELENRIQQKGLSDIIRIHDSVFGDEKKRILEQTDVFIMTSRFEGHPMGLIEALSYGIPSLVTEGTNMSVEIEESNAGWNAGSTVEDIAGAIRKMCAEKSLFREKSDNAVVLSQKYDWKEIAQKTHEQFLVLRKRNDND